MHTLAFHAFGVNDRAGQTGWWIRPHPWLLARIGERTGVPISRLQAMTLNHSRPVYRDDEASGRFTGRRYDVRPPGRHLFTYAVCCTCIAEDERPFLRSEWLIGWMAVCPKHNVRLTEKCHQCRTKLTLGRWTRETDFTPDRCTRCEERLQSYADGRPHFEVSALQKAMLAGKTGGVIHIAEVGAFTWREFVVLADILLSGVWKRTTVDEGAQLMKLFHHSSGPAYPYELRHDSLRFLAWILTGWPDSDGAEVAHEMLRRWLCCETEYSRFHLPSEWVGKDIEDRKIPPAVRDMMDQLCARFESTNSESSHAASNSPLHTPVHIWEPQFDS